MGSLLGPLFALIAALGFSSKAIFIKLAYRAAPVDAETLLALRMLTSTPFFLLMAWWSQRGAPAPMTRRDWGKLIVLGLIGYYLSSYLDFLGLQYITASLERLLLFLYPTLVVLMSASLHRRAVSRGEWLALALSYAGILLVFWHDLNHLGEAHRVLIGGALVFAAAVTYAIYLVGSQSLLRRIGSTRFTGWVMLVSSAAAVAQFAVTHPPSALAQPAPVLWCALAIAIFGTVVPTWLMAESVKRIDANRTAMIGTIGPVMTIGLGAWLLGEPITLVQVIGAALVVGGVSVVSLKKTKPG